MHHNQPLARRPLALRPLIRLAPLLGLLAFTLFPLQWLAARWRSFGRFVNTTFASDVDHAIGHALLFTLLGLLALATFPALRTRPWRYAGLLLIAGVGQECFQLLVKQRPIVFDDGRDLLVDLGGLMLAWALVWLWGRWVRR